MIVMKVLLLIFFIRCSVPEPSIVMAVKSWIERSEILTGDVHLYSEQRVLSVRLRDNSLYGSEYMEQFRINHLLKVIANFKSVSSIDKIYITYNIPGSQIENISSEEELSKEFSFVYKDVVNQFGVLGLSDLEGILVYSLTNQEANNIADAYEMLLENYGIKGKYRSGLDVLLSCSRRTKEQLSTIDKVLCGGIIFVLKQTSTLDRENIEAVVIEMENKVKVPTTVGELESLFESIG